MAGQGPIPTRAPVRRLTNIRSMSIAVAGKEQPYPAWRFSRRRFFEKPNHNPFDGL